MKPETRDAAYLWDMREAAREIHEFVRGVNYAQFASNKMLRYAVERQLLVIGEAAAHVSGAFQATHPEIPWRAIIGQRNILAHEYGEVLVERIWLAASESVPRLLSLIEPLAPPTPPAPDG